jgi:hypothetical protein
VLYESCHAISFITVFVAVCATSIPQVLETVDFQALSVQSLPNKEKGTARNM